MRLRPPPWALRAQNLLLQGRFYIWDLISQVYPFKDFTSFLCIENPVHACFFLRAGVVSRGGDGLCLCSARSMALMWLLLVPASPVPHSSWILECWLSRFMESQHHRGWKSPSPSSPACGRAPPTRAPRATSRCSCVPSASPFAPPGFWGVLQMPILIPCHRVIRSSGDTGNYGGGHLMKEWLLSHERLQREKLAH